MIKPSGYNIVNTIQSVYNTTSKGFKTAVIGAMISATPQAIAVKAHEVTPKAVCMSAEKMKEMNEKFLYDNPAYLRFLNLTMDLSDDIFTGKFLKALKDNKCSLTKDLNITDEKYDETVKLIRKIASTDERIPFSLILTEKESGSGKGQADFLNNISNSTFGNEKYEPLMRERLSIKSTTKRERALFDRYGIDILDDDMPVDKLAKASVIHALTIENTYPRYLQIIEKVRPNQADPKVQESIRNAQRILSDEVLSGVAVNELDASNLTFVDESGTVFNSFISEKDLDDLRVYASSIILPKNTYVAEMWDLHNIFPVGENKDRACANILTAILDKPITK